MLWCIGTEGMGNEKGDEEGGEEGRKNGGGRERRGRERNVKVGGTLFMR